MFKIYLIFLKKKLESNVFNFFRKIFETNLHEQFIISIIILISYT
jgi:hypothetical protein